MGESVVAGRGRPGVPSLRGSITGMRMGAKEVEAKEKGAEGNPHLLGSTSIITIAIWRSGHVGSVYLRS
jgi:hypothetical protein